MWTPRQASKRFITALKSAISPVEGHKDRCHIIIFCGAGFAKAWSLASPLSKDLFQIPTTAFKESESLLRLVDYLRKGDDGYLTQGDLKEIVSFLDLCTHHHFLLGNLMDQYSPRRLQSELTRAIKDHFRDIHYINYLNAKTGRLPVKTKKSPHRRVMVKFLSQLLHDHCEFTQNHSGVELCFVTTNYDYCVESWIQESIGKEPIFDKLYRGFTPSYMNGEENSQYLMDHPYGLKLFKLNGGFEITENSTGFAIDYRSSVTNPVMILPSSYQDYGSKYFQCVFDKAAVAFRRADLILFVGYSFPPEDSLIRRLIWLFVEDQRPRMTKKIICINRKGSQAVEKQLREIFDSTTLDLSAYTLEFQNFCQGCNYYFPKIREGRPI